MLCIKSWRTGAGKIFFPVMQCAKNPDLSSAHIRKDQLDKFAKDFSIIYNKAWAGHGGMKQVEEKVVRKMFQE